MESGSKEMNVLQDKIYQLEKDKSRISDLIREHQRDIDRLTCSLSDADKRLQKLRNQHLLIEMTKERAYWILEAWFTSIKSETTTTVGPMWMVTCVSMHAKTDGTKPIIFLHVVQDESLVYPSEEQKKALTRQVGIENNVFIDCN